MNKDFIKIAKTLGIVLPACLLVSTAKANLADVNDGVNNEYLASSQVVTNSVKDRIVQSFNSESKDSPYQITHTNVRNNYTIPHTNVHTNFTVSGKHTDQHSNTKAKYVNSHSNSMV